MIADGNGQYQRLLIANRGEIATRIISTARELGLTTFACYTDGDISHTYNATHAIRLSSSSAYTDVDEFLRIVKEHGIQAIHPGYGYLSESAVFSQRMQDAGIQVIGPGQAILEETGDKLKARRLAESCAVPILPALTTPTASVEEVESFAEQHGLPIMVKAVDGGGGRGIRLIRDMQDLRSFTTRAIQESPSRQVFAERAAVDGYRHVEVQIIGDGNGKVMHLWERECSIQRRFQKVIELAPSTIARDIVQPLIEAAVKMASKIRYRSLGTFEFLLHPDSGEYFFLEVNPRLQVEHTVTETICGLDIVELQLRLSQGTTFDALGLDIHNESAVQPPRTRAIQLRITAEDPERNWSLSTGQITSFRWPQGHGVRTDSAMVAGVPYTVSADFDSVIAKVIVSAATWSAAVSKARRALEDIEVVGVKTNIALLQTIVVSPDFLQTSCDTQWLETNHEALLGASRSLASKVGDALHSLSTAKQGDAGTISLSSSSTLFRRDDAWTISLAPLPTSASSQAQDHHLRLGKVLKNDFPATLRAEITWTSPNAEPQDYMLNINATTASAAAVAAQHRRGDPRDSSHVIIPFAGKLIEICVDEGDMVKKNDCIAVIQQMKMELEVRSQIDGTVTWLCDIADGEDVAEGVLAAIVDSSARPKL